MIFTSSLSLSSSKYSSVPFSFCCRFNHFYSASLRLLCSSAFSHLFAQPSVLGWIRRDAAVKSIAAGKPFCLHSCASFCGRRENRFFLFAISYERSKSLGDFPRRKILFVVDGYVPGTFPSSFGLFSPLGVIWLLVHGLRCTRPISRPTFRVSDKCDGFVVCVMCLCLSVSVVFS